MLLIGSSRRRLLNQADFRFYSSYDGHAGTVKGTVIEGLDLWVSDLNNS